MVNRIRKVVIVPLCLTAPSIAASIFLNGAVVMEDRRGYSSARSFLPW